MRRERWILLALLAGCASDDEGGAADTRLAIDVQVSDTSILVRAREPERPCECSFGWTEVGTCRGQSDAISCTCDPWPASCLEEVALVAAGQTLATAAWDPMWWGVSFALETAAGDELVIAGCGAEASVLLPAEPRPRTAIEIDDAGLVTWSSEPLATSSLVEHGDGFAAESCHRDGGSGELETAADGPDRYVSVTALAGPILHETELAAIRVWSGNGSELTLE
ncbi:MAG TPA: hypothetical protein VIG06_29950 [Kofleriaceae bacterium]|jgi:hypothetical protein